MDRILWKAIEVAELLGIGRSKVYELIANGTLPSVRIGASVRVPADALRAWIGKQGNRAPAAKDEIGERA